MAHYIEEKRPIKLKKRSGGFFKSILPILGIFAVMAVIGIAWTMKTPAKKHVMQEVWYGRGEKIGKYVENGRYEVDSTYRTFPLDPAYLYDYESYDCLSCLDRNGKSFKIGRCVGDMNPGPDYDVSVIKIKTDTLTGSILFKNKRRRQ